MFLNSRQANFPFAGRRALPSGRRAMRRRRRTPLALLLLLSALFGQTAWSTEVEELRLWRAPDHTRLVFDLSEAADYELFTLNNPDRVVIDIRGATRRDPFANLPLDDTPIRAVRSAPREGDLRIVLDLDARVEPSSFILEPTEDSGDRLVVDLYDNEPRQVAAAAPAPAPSPVDSSVRRDIVVAISAGHGGEDPGSIGYNKRIYEKDVTLGISRFLAERLEAMPGYQPVMIRDSDYYVQLDQRPEIARRHRADLFVAIHADWYRSSSANGATLYALSGDRADRENSARVAEKENSSDLLGGVDGDLSLGTFDDDVALTLVSLQMAWSMEQSLIAGTHILNAMGGVTRLRRDKVQQASLQVLNSPDIPSVLIETGYLSNPAEADRLNTAAFQRQLAAAIAQGIQDYFYAAPPAGSMVAWRKANGILPGSYTVARGDSLSQIAARFGLSTAALKRLNGLSGDTIRIGQVLKLNGSTEAAEHRIRRGETLSEIAAQYRVSLSSLRQLNNLQGDRIMVGQVLKIPAI